jgi:hypothetical protein
VKTTKKRGIKAVLGAVGLTLLLSSCTPEQIRLFVAVLGKDRAVASDAALARLRNCESGGNYGAVSPDGLYRGAYQFHAATWNNVASMAGRPDLVGVLANLASPADQDLLAVTLYRAAGAGPWGGYCA